VQGSPAKQANKQRISVFFGRSALLRLLSFGGVRWRCGAAV